jgi:Zn-dependent protease with chaperone function
VILGDRFGGAGTDFKRRVVGIGIGKLNTLSYDAILAVICHEFGHIFRHERPNEPAIGRLLPALTRVQFEEVEADRFSVCLVGKAANLTALTSGNNSDSKFPISLRAEAVDDFSFTDCPNLKHPRKIDSKVNGKSLTK